MALLKGGYGRLEADFQRFYGIDLGDLDTGVLRVFRAANLAANLPVESSTWRHLNEFWAWDVQAQLLAVVADRLAEVDYTLRFSPHFRGKPKAPKPLARPWDAPVLDPGVTRIGAGEGFDTTAEFDEWLASKRKKK